jgi:biotin operon repressor
MTTIYIKLAPSKFNQELLKLLDAGTPYMVAKAELNDRLTATFRTRTEAKKHVKSLEREGYTVEVA